MARAEKAEKKSAVKKSPEAKAEGKAAKKAKAVSKAAATSGSASVTDYATLLSPVITEKSSIVGENNTVVFTVDGRASKDEIKGAIERVFSVKVSAVRTVRYSGKSKRTARGYTRTAGYKKAYVKLKEGSKINVVEGL